MEIKEAIEKNGIGVVIRSFYPELHGIDFSKVVFNEDFNKSGFSSIDKTNLENWYFSIGTMPILYKVFPKKTIENDLNKLLIRNGINLKNSYEDNNARNVKLWDGDGFKFEKVSIGDLNLIIITCIGSITKESLVYNKTDLAKKIKNPNWISEFDNIYDAESIDEKNKILSKFVLTPLLFKDRDSDNGEDFILIPVSSSEFSRPLILKIIEDNGGLDSYTQIECDGWEDLFRGHIFNIGYLPTQRAVRINRIPANTERVDGKKVLTGIHKLSGIINKKVKGLNKQIFNEAEGFVTDGRLIATSLNANNIVAFSNDTDEFVKMFKKIVFEYNKSDEFLKISKASIKSWIDRYPKETISFAVNERFEIILSKGETSYQINLFPPGGLMGNWELKPDDFQSEEKPKVVFSKPIKLKKTVVIPNNSDVDIEKSKEDLIDEKNKFIDQSINNEDEDEKIKSNNSFWGSNIIKWLLIIIGIIILFSLLRNCDFSKNEVDYFNRGVKNYKSGKFDKAYKDFERAIDLDNSYVDPYVTRSEMNIENKKYLDAKTDLDQAILRDNSNWYLHYLRGFSNMNLATSRYSRYYKDALSDFTKSIELNSSFENGKSFYYRGKVYQILKDDKFCEDFYKACDYSILDSCALVNQFCRPKTGFMPYEKIFGPGISTGSGIFSVTNDCDYDMVITLKSLNNRNRVIRSQYVRSGDKLVIENVPRGRYIVNYISGKDWTFDKVLSDGISKGGFLFNQKTEKVNKIWRFTGNNSLGYRDCVVGGNLTNSEISESEFFNR